MPNARLDALEKDVRIKQQELTVLCAKARNRKDPKLFQSVQGKRIAKEITKIVRLRDQRCK